MRITIYSKIKIVALLLLTSLNVWAGNTEIIYLVHNNNVAKNVMIEDSEYLDLNVKRLSGWLKKINPNLVIKTLPLNSLFDLSKEIKANLGDAKLRGVVFMGHGNNSNYAFSNEEVFSGDKKLIKIIKPLLSKTMTAGRLLLYFSGCSMGGGKQSFQEVLISNLAKAKDNKVDVEIIAHINSVNLKGGAYAKPTFIDRFLIKTKIGIFVERFQMLPARFVGGYAPTIMNILASAGVPGLFLLVTGHPSEYAPAFLLVAPLMSILSSSASKLGYSKGFTDNAKDFVFNLLQKNLHSPANNLCNKLFL